MIGSSMVKCGGWRSGVAGGLEDLARPGAAAAGLAVLVIHVGGSGAVGAWTSALVASGRDLDGDGLVLEMLVEDRLGPWTPSEDARFLVLAKNGQGPRYRRLRGVRSKGEKKHLARIERCFLRSGKSSDWRPKAAEPLALALRQLFRTRSVAGVLVFGGNHGGIAYPGRDPRGPGRIGRSREL
ncbi:MAG: hypothetical protein R3F17_12330 [Planctomycetota bacterium]